MVKKKKEEEEAREREEEQADGCGRAAGGGARPWLVPVGPGAQDPAAITAPTAAPIFFFFFCISYLLTYIYIYIFFTPRGYHLFQLFPCEYRRGLYWIQMCLWFTVRSGTWVAVPAALGGPASVGASGWACGFVLSA